MASTITVETTVTIDGEDGDAADAAIKYTKSRTFTLTEEVLDRKYTLNNETVIVWDTSVAGLNRPASFAVLLLWADGDLDLELTINEGDVNEELVSLRLAANTVLCLGADDAYYSHGASDVFAGTLDVIDKLRVRNPAATDVKLRVVLGA